MDAKLKKECLSKIYEVYSFAKNDTIILVGSRASGMNLPNSDVDIEIFTNNCAKYAEASVQQGLRKKGENPGFEFAIRKNILLEVKIYSYNLQCKSLKSFDVLFHSKVLQPQKNYYKMMQNIKKSWNGQYENELQEHYVEFFNEFKEMEGIIKRKDEASRQIFEIKKAIVIHDFARLILIMQKQTYPSDKFLLHRVYKSKYGKDAKKIMNMIAEIKDEKSLFLFKDYIRKYLTTKMPPRPYVGAWWKFLKN